MLLRLILMLLLATFALPRAAPAACHAQSHASALAHHAPPRDAVPLHGCIGCIPPSDWLRAPAVRRMPAARPTLAAQVTTLDLGRGLPPALPPPRRG